MHYIPTPTPIRVLNLHHPDEQLLAEDKSVISIYSNLVLKYNHKMFNINR